MHHDATEHAVLYPPPVQATIPGADGPVGELDGLAQPVQLPSWIRRALAAAEDHVTARTWRLVAAYAAGFGLLELLCWATR